MSRVAALAFALVTLASPAGAQTLRAYMDVNSIGIKSTEAAHTDILTTTCCLPIGASEAAYPVLPTISGVQINAGVKLAGNFGAGVRVSLFARYETTIRLTTDSGPANSALQRKQRVVDLSAVYFVPTRAPGAFDSSAVRASSR